MSRFNLLQVSMIGVVSHLRKPCCVHSITNVPVSQKSNVDVVQSRIREIVILP